ncbi:MAG TPA: TonB-dependent receptor [Prolixibacteraceae bacterium]|nr:TonB-dependent receptor [Prolixibacteraceae bacterium]
MKKILLILFILNSVLAEGQETISKLRFGITGGFGTFSQSDLKSLNQTVMDQLPFDAKIVDEFEPNFNFGGYTQYQLFNRFWLGPEYRYYYTGSRLGQKDYSGVYSFDQYLHSHTVGLKMGYVVAEIDRFSFQFQVNSGVGFTKWKMDSKLKIGEESENQIDNLKGFSWYALPSFAVNYKIFDNLSLVGSAGYSIDLIKKCKYEANSDIKIVKNPDWSGLRLTLGLEYEL